MIRKCDELMVHNAPQIYRKYITMNKNGDKTLYTKLQMTLHGMMKSAL